MTPPNEKDNQVVTNSLTVIRNPAVLKELRDMTLTLLLSRRTIYFLFFLLVGCIFLYYSTVIYDYDVWWHFRLGEHYVKNHTLRVDHSIFSWTPADPGWIYNTWLGSTIFYLAYKAAAGFGLWLILWFVLSAIFLLYYFYVRSVKGGLGVSDIAGLLLAAIAINLTTVISKPENLTVLLFSVAVFLYFYGKTHGKKLYYFYPPLFVLWVNVHGGFLLGLVFISAVLGGETLNLLFFKNNRLPKGHWPHLLAAVLLSYLATLINPYGVDYHISVLSGMFAKEYMGYAEKVSAYVSMWQYLIWQTFQVRFIYTAWIFIIFALTFGSLCIYAYVKKKFLDISLILLNLAFFFFGMSAGRYTIFFPIIALFSLTFIQGKIKIPDLEKRVAPAALILFLFFTASIAHTSLVYVEENLWFGINFDNTVPKEEMRFIREMKLPAPLFNDYVIGGYMMWALYPDYKVMMDPRYGPYWKQVGPDFMTFMQNVNPQTVRQFVAKYPSRVAVIHMMYYPVIIEFLRTGEWAMLYFDRIAAVIVHKSVIPQLSPAALATNVGPERFKELKDPKILLNLFKFYIEIAPVYAKTILDIYKTNVRAWYYHKDDQIAGMARMIEQKEQEIQSLIKAQQLQRPN